MADIFDDYMKHEQTRNKKIEENEMEVGVFDKARNRFNSFLSSGNANKMALVMFYLLLILGEWKVFEASMALTENNIELSLSVLLVTGVSAAVAERAHQNPKATKDQKWLANMMWYLNLITAGVFGFIAFILSGKDLQYDIVLLPGLSFNIDGASTILFGIVTILTFAEIIAYRMYYDKDVDVAAKRRLAGLHEKARKADLDLAEEKQTQSTRIKIDQEKTLALLEEKLNIIQTLNEKYSGKVPQNVLDNVIKELTGEDVHVNLPVIQKTEKSIPSSNLDIKQKRKYTKRHLTNDQLVEKIEDDKKEVEVEKMENFTNGEQKDNSGW